uniref:HVA22-like protein n=1 Tax=Rhizophora mucronata TaxID=61149 RepID=A0A2P2KIE8_RHIMU
MKFAFLVWLQLPSTNGARQLYTNHLRPFLVRHQARLDQIMEFLYVEMVRTALIYVMICGMECHIGFSFPIVLNFSHSRS